MVCPPFNAKGRENKNSLEYPSKFDSDFIAIIISLFCFFAFLAIYKAILEN
jgi:hypothetical protein